MFFQAIAGLTHTQHSVWFSASTCFFFFFWFCFVLANWRPVLYVVRVYLTYFFFFLILFDLTLFALHVCRGKLRLIERQTHTHTGSWDYWWRLLVDGFFRFCVFSSRELQNYSSKRKFSILLLCERASERTVCFELTPQRETPCEIFSFVQHAQEKVTW